MHYLSEDPWYPAGALGLLAIGFLVALQVTQDGRYLIKAGVSAGLAGLLLLVESLWVTDNERIERVVYDLANAVSNSDSDRALSHFAPRVSFGMRNGLVGEDIDKESLKEGLASTTFDWVHVSRLSTSAGKLTKQGTAEFRALASGTLRSPLATNNFASAATEWSLGFRQDAKGEWKVTRITALRLPPLTYIPFLRVKSRIDSAPSSVGYPRGVTR